MLLPISMALARAAAAADCEECTAPPAIEIDAVYTGEAWRNTSGGLATGNRYLDNIDLTASLDGGQLFGIEGMKLFGYALYENGHVLSDDLVGAAQGVSNIEAPPAVRLYELWSEWQFGSAPGTVRFGLYDLNSEFDAIETAGLFVNPSHGIGPDFSQSGANGPSIFPNTSLAVRGAVSSGSWTYRAAILDGVPGDAEHPDRTRVHFDAGDGYLFVGEIDYAQPSGLRFGAGYWRYSAEFDDLTALDAEGAPLQRNDNAGAYLIAESPRLFARGTEDGLRFFARTGIAQDHINPLRRYTGAGAVLTGMWLPDDQLGLALAVASLGEPWRESQHAQGLATDEHEYIWELSYRFALTGWLTLQPDVQYVRNPGMNPDVRDAWLVGLRFELAHGWSR
jgi:porin